MSKLISRITSRSNSTPSDKSQQSSSTVRDNNNDKVPHSTSMSRKPSSISKRSTSLSISTSSSNSDPLSARPVVKSPDWSIRYDPTLSVYYYVNDKTNETQFDHPDEVVSPTSSPITKQDSFANGVSIYDTDHRKIFSTSLKRTLSPRFLSTNKDNEKQSRSKSNSPRSSSDLKKNAIPKVALLNDDNNDMDEDVEEFRKQLELEMKTYECERLRST